MEFQRVSATVWMMFDHRGLDALHIRVVADERLSDDCADCFRYGLLLFSAPSPHRWECLGDLSKSHCVHKVSLFVGDVSNVTA